MEKKLQMLQCKIETPNMTYNLLPQRLDEMSNPEK